MSEQELFDKIEAYIQGELSAEEKVVFEAQIASDPALAQEVKMHRFEHEAMNVLIAKKTKAKLTAWAEEERIQERKKWWWIGGLSMLLLISIIFIFSKMTTDPAPSIENTIQEQEETENTSTESPIDTIETPPLEPTDQSPNTNESSGVDEPPAKKPTKQRAIAEENNRSQDKSAINSSNTNNQQLALASYNDSSLPNVTLGILRSETNENAKAEEAYKAGEFEQTIQLLEDESNKSPLIHQMLGHAYFQMGAYEKSATAFEAITNGNDPAFARKVEFYLLLSYLAQGMEESEEFTGLLDKLMDSERHPNNKDATKLSEKLNLQTN